MKRKWSKRLSAIALIALFSVLLGCASAQHQSVIDNSYKTLLSSYHLYQTTFLALAELHSKGFLTEAQKIEAVELGTAYATAHNTAVAALLELQKADPDNFDSKLKAYTAAALLVTQQMSKLLSYAQPLFGGKK